MNPLTHALKVNTTKLYVSLRDRIENKETIYLRESQKYLTQYVPMGTKEVRFRIVRWQ